MSNELVCEPRSTLDMNWPWMGVPYVNQIVNVSSEIVSGEIVKI